MKSITELKGKHNGTPIVIIGGGEFVIQELYMLFGTIIPGCIFISANEHGYKLNLSMVKPDYFCFVKSHNESPNLMPYIKDPQGAVRICKVEEQYSDYKVDIPVALRGFTGHFATWLASYLTDSDIILCGFDCYSGEKPYYDDRKNEMMTRFPLDNHLRQWEICKNGHSIKQRTTFINPDRIYSVSGPLTSIFKQWK